MKYLFPESSALFSSPHRYDPNFIEAIVTSVDHTQKVCSVRTIDNRTFTDVIWTTTSGGVGSAGFHFTPGLGNKVLVNLSTTNPVIIGCLPQLGSPPTGNDSMPMLYGELDSEIPPSRNIRGGKRFNPNAPPDMVQGDQVLSGHLGNLLAALNSGTILARASAYSQIILTRFDRWIKVLAQNYLRISDACSEASVNLKNRVYHFFGADNDPSRTRTSDPLYRYREYYGDTSLAEQHKDMPDYYGSFPSKNNIIRKYQLVKADNTTEIYIETLNLSDGSLITIVKDSGTTTVTQQQTKWDCHVVQGTTSYATILPGSITLDHDAGTATVILNGSNVYVEYSGSTLVIDSTGIKLDAKGHYLYIDSTGVHSG